jgi:hypothetical protein
MIIVCFYSKYSSLSTLFLERLSHSALSDTVRYVCLDKAKIRDLILRDNRYRISTVPCILVMREHEIDKYEGSEVWEWLKSIEEDGTEMNSQIQLDEMNQGQEENDGNNSVAEGSTDEKIGDDEQRSVDPVVTQVKPIDIMTLAKRMQEERGGEK